VARSESRLRRAKQHVDRLRMRLVKYFNRLPYRHDVEKDLDGWKLHKLGFTRPIPESCIHDATEALEALASTAALSVCLLPDLDIPPERWGQHVQ